MVLKKDEPADQLTIVDEWDKGFTWRAHPDADFQRTSHAIRVDDGIWIIDPMDAAGLDEKLIDLGTPAGVVMLSSIHRRHVDRIAQRHNVDVYVPDWFDEASREFDAPVSLITDSLVSTGFELLNLREKPWRQGAALYHPERKTLVVSDSLATTLFSKKEGRLELFPPARINPSYHPLRNLEVDRLLLSHGDPITEDATLQLERALNQEYRGTAAAILTNLPTFARLMVTSLRE